MSINSNILHTSHHTLFILHTTCLTILWKELIRNSLHTLHFTYFWQDFFYKDETLVLFRVLFLISLPFFQELPIQLSLPVKNCWTSQQHTCKYYRTSQLLFKGVNFPLNNFLLSLEMCSTLTNTKFLLYVSYYAILPA